MLSLKQGQFLVRLARASIENYFAEKAQLPRARIKELREKALGKGAEFGKLGVFVTLHSAKGELRGCIGYTLPFKEADEAAAELALESAFADTRFAPLSRDKLGDTIVEVSVLSVPKEVAAKKPEDFVKAVKVGRDGLVIDYGGASGLLLPQVAVEEGFDAQQFLDCVCWKAGLPQQAWRDERGGKPVARISTFQAQVFAEEKPGGKVAEKKR